MGILQFGGAPHRYALRRPGTLLTLQKEAVRSARWVIRSSVIGFSCNPSVHRAHRAQRTRRAKLQPSHAIYVLVGWATNRYLDVLTVMERVRALEEIKQREGGQGEPEKRGSTHFRWAGKPER